MFHGFASVANFSPVFRDVRCCVFGFRVPLKSGTQDRFRDVSGFSGLEMSHGLRWTFLMPGFQMFHSKFL